MTTSAIIARWLERFPLDRAQLASLARIPLDRLERLERDQELPTRAELEVLAGIAGLRTDDLYRDEWSSPLAPLFFKAAQAGRLGDLETRSDWPGISQFTRAVRDIAELEQALGELPPLLPRPSLAGLPDHPTHAGVLLALRVRQLFGLGLDPVGSFVGLLKQRGIQVLAAGADEVAADVRGVSLGEPRPAILLPLRDWYQRRFALAHELCHLVIDTIDYTAMVSAAPLEFAPDDREREVRADAFAANFLAPDAGVTRIVGQTWPNDPADERNIEAVARHFGVGRIVAINRIANNFPAANEKRTHMELRHHSWARWTPPDDVPIPTASEVIRDLAYRALTVGRITPNRVRELLGLRRDEPLPRHPAPDLTTEQLAPSIEPRERARRAAWSHVIHRGHPDAEIDRGVETQDGWRFGARVSGARFDIRVNRAFVPADA